MELWRGLRVAILGQPMCVVLEVVEEKTDVKTCVRDKECNPKRV